MNPVDAVKQFTANILTHMNTWRGSRTHSYLPNGGSQAASDLQVVLGHEMTCE